MKYLVLGCNGMAGHLISLYLKEQGNEVIGFAKTKSAYVDSIIGDATDAKLLIQIIQKGKYDIIINCIGILNQAAEENKALAVYLNAYLPHELAEITKNMDTKVIHISTDCVFSGERGNYTENDFRDGKTFYDRSKALGELNDNKNITLRNSIVGPDINPHGIGLMNWFLQQSNAVNGFTKSIWTGQTTLQLAKTIEYVATHKCCGLINAVPECAISKYELLRLMNKYIAGDSFMITPVEGAILDKSLKRTNYSCGLVVPNYDIMMRELADWVRIHKDMYPHYKTL